MEAVHHERYADVLTKAGLRVADPGHRIGLELTYTVPVPRMVVLHFGKSDTEAYVLDAVARVLRLADAWLLVPRYGSASKLGLLDSAASMAAISFSAAEHSQLARYLYSRPMDFDSSSQDLYVLSANGGVLVTWDHHMADEGLRVELLSVKDTEQLLVSL